MIVEDRLTFDDGPAPAPRPAPQPTVIVPVKPKAAPPTWWQIAPWVATLAFMAGFGWQYYKSRPAPTPPTPVVDATDAGKAWAKELPLTFADSFGRAQIEVRDTDKPMADVRKDHVERWKAARDDAFNARFEKILDSVIAPGNDKPTTDQRRQYADVMGQIITGTKQGAK